MCRFHCRREIFDHVIALNEQHLRRLIRDYVSYHHQNDYTTELMDIAQSKEAAENLAQRCSLQAGLLATHVYRHILVTQELFALFSEETGIPTVMKSRALPDAHKSTSTSIRCASMPYTAALRVRKRGNR